MKTVESQLSAQPRPWRHNASEFGELQDPNGKSITVSGLGIGMGSRQQWPHAAANAEYILNAVNSHDALLEALRHVRSNIDVSVIRPGRRSEEHWNRVIDVIEAAISLATNNATKE